MDLEQRLTELETRIAFLDQTVQSLDATVAAQDRILQDLQRQIAQFRGELGRVNALLASDAQDEPPPPHY
jgi:SlyX protein